MILLAYAEDVIQVGEGMGHPGQDMVYRSLEGVTSIPHAEGHPGKIQTAGAVW